MKIKLKKIVAFSLLVVVSIIIAASAFVYRYKDDIAKKLLLRINTYTKGELQIRDININPLVHFPNISLTLNEPRYFEKKTLETDSLNHQMFHFSKLHVAFDLLELLEARIEITAISADNGSINIVQNPDSSFNITNAFLPIDTIQSVPNKLVVEEDSSLIKTDISLAMDQLKLNDIDVNISLLRASQQLTIHRANASLKYVSDSIECNLNTDLFIHRAGFDEAISLENEELIIAMDFFLDRNEHHMSIYQSDIEFRKAQLYTKGMINFNKDGEVDLSFEANDEELQFTNLFLTSEGLKNIRAGGLFLEGTIKGNMSDQLPKIACTFGANNLKIQITNSEEYLENINVDGRFSSGSRADFSKATLKIDTVTARLPSGYIQGSAQITNLKTPEVKYNLDASFKLNELNNIFELGPLENLKGRVIINDKYQGLFREDYGWMDASPEPFFLKLDSVSFLLSNIMTVDLLDGSISGNLDTLNITNFYVETQKSDFKIEGIVHNISNFIYKKDHPIKAELSMDSELYDFPDFFAFLPKVAESFPYQISNAHLDFELETTYEKLKHFNKSPGLNFKIHKASGTIESFLPHAELKNGTFNMYEEDSTSILDFQDFDIEIADACAKANYTLYNNPEELDSMTITLSGNEMNTAKIFYDAESDSISEIIDAEISGEFRCSIVLPNDSNLLFQSVSLHAQDFIYYGIDTISAKSFDMHSYGISYDKHANTTPLETLVADNDLYFEELATSVFQAESFDISVNIADGQYILIPHDHQQFGEDEQGKIELYPFDNPPRYHLEYSIKQLPIHDFLSSFYSEKLFTGFVNLDLNLTSSGEDVEQITSNMSGSIILEGDSLILTGMNLDDLINNFRRSQSFNLVDIGAIALAGPTGLLYTKGSDYAVLFVAKKGDSTIISKISSKWNLEDGNIAIEDVAIATLENRVAATGWLNMKSDSLDLIIGVVEESGCAIIDQRIYGRSDEPEYGKVKVIKTLLSPVTKLLNNIVNKDCESFYNGIVQHPQPKYQRYTD